MKRVLFMAAFFVITAALSQVGCKKAGPVVPYDLRIPPLDANLQVFALDKGNPVSLLQVSVLDPEGNSLTGVTDIFGRCGWKLEDMKKGTWAAVVPAQGRYDLSTIPFATRAGDIAVTFVSNPRLLIEPLTTTRYAYSTQTDMAFNLVYDQGGALNVPVSIAARPMPGGWTYNFTPTVLGLGGVNTASVSLSVPPNQYTQPVMDFWAVLSGPLTYTGTDFAGINGSVTISRGFPISITGKFDFNVTSGDGVLDGFYYINCVNVTGITWTGTFTIGDSTNTSNYYYDSGALALSCGVSQYVYVDIPAFYGDHIPTFSFNVTSAIGSYIIDQYHNNQTFFELSFNPYNYYSFPTSIF